MKALKFLLSVILLIGITCCKKENFNSGINFCTNDNTSEIVVKYNEILGYDSINHVFLVNEPAWNRIKNKITPMYPDPHFAFGVTLNNQIIYSAKFIPYYYSMSNFDLITFMPIEPNLIYINLGYPPSPELFQGMDNRNDSRIIAQLKKDNKLIEVD